MERDPGDFEQAGDESPRDGGEDDIDRLLASLPPAPGIKHIDDDDDEDIAEALADVAAGRCYDHEIVGQWLKTWGQPDQKPFEEWLADQDA